MIRLITRYAPFAAILILYYVAARLVGADPVIGTSTSAVLGLRIIPELVALYLMLQIAWIAAVRQRSWAGLGRAVASELWTGRTAERLVGIPFFVLGTVLAFDIYGAVKQAIPTLTTYRWDAPFARLDALLHGADPWIWTHRLAGGGLPLAVIDQVYQAWYPVLILSVLVFATWAPLRLRTRFFLTFALTLALGGSLLATLLASGGPVYYAEFVGDAGRFAELVEALEGTAAISIQALLWDAFSTGSEQLYGGISAMPSMHVALVVLMAAGAWSWARWLGVVAWIYAVLILFGSVHLGWHYAVDGYVAAPLVLGLWILVDRLLPDDDLTPPEAPAARSRRPEEAPPP